MAEEERLLHAEQLIAVVDEMLNLPHDEEVSEVDETTSSSKRSSPRKKLQSANSEEPTKKKARGRPKKDPTALAKKQDHLILFDYYEKEVGDEVCTVDRSVFYSSIVYVRKRDADIDKNRASEIKVFPGQIVCLWNFDYQQPLGKIIFRNYYDYIF